MSDLLISALMFPALFALIFLGFPVAFSLLVTAIGFGLPLFGFRIGSQSYQFVETVASNYVLAAIPLFVLMGSMLERSGIAERLYLAMRIWLGGLPGGLAVATIAMAAIFAAATGIVGAVETLIGMMAIPSMMRVKYNHGLIAGTICAGGSLGTIIPPSIVVVVYASIAQISIGKLMVGIIIPGLLMVTLFIGYIIIRCIIRPSDGPGLQPGESTIGLGEKVYLLVTALLPALALVIAVIGSMIAGFASPTEAAGVGVVATFALTLIYRTFTWDMLKEALRTTVTVTTMITLIIVGGTMFTSVFRVSGGAKLVDLIILTLNLQPAGLIMLFLLIIFILGFVLDWVSIVLITIPIFAPIIKAAGIDPLWFAVMAVVVIQTSYLTPPMAPAIFYLRAVAPPAITYQEMYWGIVPFVICQLIALAVVAIWPPAATLLADTLIGF